MGGLPSGSRGAARRVPPRAPQAKLHAIEGTSVITSLTPQEKTHGSLPELGVGRSARRPARRQRRRHAVLRLRRHRAWRQVRRANSTIGLGRVAGLPADALGGVGDGRGRVEHGPRRSRRLDVRLVRLVVVAFLVRRRRRVEADGRHGQHEGAPARARPSDDWLRVLPANSLESSVNRPA